MSADWTIRPAGAEEADALALIGGASFLESFAGVIDGAALVAHCAHQHAAETYRGYFAKGARAWIAGLAPGGAPVGYALLSPPELDQARAGDIELKRIYVLARFQGSGVAAALMAAAIGAAQRSPQNFERLLLGVKADNDRALAFYRKHGFAVIGDRQFDVGGKTYDDLVLARDLISAPQATNSRQLATG